MQNKTRSFGTLGTSFAAVAAKSQAHRMRCKNLPPMQPGEAERLMAGFLATRDVTACPARYAAPVEQQSHLARSGY
jgi:hypothetical protein